MKIFPSRTELCLVPLRDMVIFPNMVVPFFVGRKKSIRAVQEAMGKGKLLFLGGSTKLRCQGEVEVLGDEVVERLNEPGVERHVHADAPGEPPSVHEKVGRAPGTYPDAAQAAAQPPATSRQPQHGLVLCA